MADKGLNDAAIRHLMADLKFSERLAAGPHVGRTFGREIIRQMIRDVQALLFPDFLDRDQIGDDPQMVKRPLEQLTDLIHQVTLHQCLSGRCLEREAAQEKAVRFFTDLPALQSEALKDAEASFEGDPAAKSLAEIISTYPGFYATLVYRMAHRLQQMGVALLPRMMTELAHSDTGIDIHPGAAIGLYFFIDHGTGVVIGETTEIGDRVTLYQGVTLGALNFPHDGEGRLIRNTKRHPTIEHDVVIYSEATILGGTTVIGHDSIIGGNVWLTDSVPPFSKVTTTSTIALRSRQEPVT